MGALLPILLVGCTAQVSDVGESKAEHVGQVKQASTTGECELSWTAETAWFCDSIGQSECAGTCGDGTEPDFTPWVETDDDDPLQGFCECSCCKPQPYHPPDPEPCPWWWICS
jgi:hypothetical protein